MADLAEKYGKLIDDRTATDRQRLLTVGESVRSVNPDARSRALAVSQQTGIPADVAERNPDDAENVVLRRKYDDILRKSPGYAKWLAESPDHAALSKDDLDNGSALDETLAVFKRGGRALASGIYGKVGEGLAGTGLAVVEPIATGVGFAQTGATMPGASPQVRAVGALAPGIKKATDAVTEFLQWGAAGSAATAKQLAGDRSGAGTFERGVYSGLESFAMNAPAMVVGVATGRADVALAGMTGLSGGLSYNQAREKGLSPMEALPFAVGQATVEYATEKLPFTKLLDDLSDGAPFYRVLFDQMAREIPGEQVATVLQDLNEWVSLNPEKTAAEYLAERPEAAAETLVATIVATGAQTGVLKGVDAALKRATQDDDKAGKAKELAKGLEILGKLSEASKLRQRSPEAFAKFVEQSVADGANRDVEIPIERFQEYYQSLEADPAQAAADILGSPDSYYEAAAAGTAIRIPLAVYTAKIAPTPAHQALMRDIRLAPDEMTLREAEDWEKQRDQYLSESTSVSEQTGVDASRPVYDDVVGQLLATGMERSTAEKNAMLMQAVFRTLGQRSGKDPLALYQRYGLSVRRVLPDVLKSKNIDTELDPLIDRMRGGGVDRKQAFGPSIAEFLVSIGGLQDQGGELAARDVKKSFRGLMKPQGLTFDDAAEKAVEAGYISERTEQALLDALDREQRGDPVYSLREGREELRDLSRTLDALQNVLDEAGVDLRTADNATIKALLKQPADRGAGTEFEQRAKADTQTLDIFAQPDQSVQAPAVTAAVEPEAAEPESVESGEAATPVPEATPAGKLDDVGENLWYNRRNFTGRGLQWDEVAGLNDTLKIKEVVKTKVWPRPDYEDLVDGGMQPIVARLIKQVYDGIGATPTVRGEAADADLKLYVDTVQRVRDGLFAWARDKEAVDALVAAADAVVESRKRGVYYTEIDSNQQKVLLTRLWPEEMAKDRYTRFSRESQGGKELRVIGGNKPMSAMQFTVSDMIDAAKDVAEGWPAKKEAWQVRFDILEVAAGETVYRNGQRVKLEASEFFITKKGSRRILADKMPTREAAIEKAKEMAGASKRKGGDSRGMNLTEAVREGPQRRRPDQDATPQILMDAFGFRGVNFGREGWINQTERQAYLNAAYDGLTDLAEILGVPAKALSLNGLLGIAFGAQGRGGSAAAHFVPGVNEINLTKTMGAGTLAHEWGHALDHHFAVQAGLSKSAEPFMSGASKVADTAAIRPEMAAAFKAVSSAMRSRAATPEEMERRQKAGLEEGVKRLNSWLTYARRKIEAVEVANKDAILAEFDQFSDRLRAGDVGEGYVKSGNKTYPQVVALLRNLIKDATGRMMAADETDSLSANANSVAYSVKNQAAAVTHIPQVKTEYLRESQAKDGDKGGKAYWATPTEMFARAFESWVSMQLAARAQKNTFLTDADIRAANVNDQGGFTSPYPRGVDATKINAAISSMVDSLKTRETDRGVELYQSVNDANSGTDSPEFRNWFGESKVVDADGNPLVVYHGTAGDFTSFDFERIGQTFNDDDEGFFFTSYRRDSGGASSYAKRASEIAGGGGNVMPVYVSLQNPLVIEDRDGMGAIPYFEDSRYGYGKKNALQDMRDGGHDGLIVRSIDEKGRVGEQMVMATRPEQIKSAIGNRGTFDPSNPDILFQSAFHGSPHNFERFDLSKIGTGEGAQSYGWGIYLADAAEVAKGYATRLGTHEFPSISPELSQAIPSIVARDIARRGMPAVVDQLNLETELIATTTDPQLRAIRTAMIEALEKLRDSGEASVRTGFTYAVDIPDDAVAKLLDWDKPLSEQPESTQKAVKATLDSIPDGDLPGYENMTGEDIHRHLFEVLAAQLDEKGISAEEMRADKAASMALQEHGIPGLRYLDAASRGSKTGTYNTVVWDQSVLDRINESVERQLFQRGNDSKRGSIKFGADRQFTISLLEKANLSTFLHESGHFYLEVLADLAAEDGATDQIKDDYAALLKWFGVKDRSEITVEHHEKFARGFEAYLMEGKAPSVELASIFSRFRAWLVSIYKQIRALNVEMTDDVRRVMDRLVATDDEIAAAEKSQQYVNLFATAEDAGMSPEEFSAYRNAAEVANQEATEQLTKRVLSQLNREQKAWWKEERDKLREDVTAEVNGQPVYRALAYLQQGTQPDGSALPDGAKPVKLSKKALQDQYGDEFMKRLPKPYVYSKADGVAPEIVADLFGFSSGDEMIQALVNARPRKQLIEAITDDRMREKFGDALNDGTLADQAMASVHTDKRAELMAAELRALRRKVREARPAVRAAELTAAREAREARQANDASLPRGDDLMLMRAAAAGAIARKRVRDIRPIEYQLAEAKAGREAFELAGKGKFEDAYAAKRRQILNHELYRAAVAAQEETAAAVEYLRTFEKRPARERLGKAKGDYLDQIDQILEQYGFRRVSPAGEERRQTLLAWAQAQEEKGLTVAIPDAILKEARRIPYQEVPFERLQAVRDAVKNIEHLARLKNKLLAGKKKRDFDDTVAAIVSGIEANHKRKAAEFDFAPSFRERIVDGLKQFAAEHTKMEFLFSWLDGEKEQGEAWSALFKPLADAESDEARMMRDARNEIARIFEAYPDADRSSLFGRKVYVPEVGKSFTRASLLAVALNQGNEYNREAVKQGYKWTDAQVAAVLRKLDARDFEAVNAIWQYLDTYWPQIAELEREMTGLPPEKVKSDPITFHTGQTFAGGYYPLRFDTRLSFRAEQREESSAVQDLYGGQFARAATKKGHTKERTDTGGQAVRLDLGVLTEHVTNVIHDLTHRRAIIDTDRLISSDAVRTAIEETAGRQMYRQLRPWLRAIASDYREPVSVVEKILNHARTGATIVNMGFKITTAIVQPLGYLQTVDVLGTKYSAIGLKRFYGAGTPASMNKAMQFAMERSEQLRNRMKTFDRDVRDQIKTLSASGKMDRVKHSFFIMTGLMDMGVAVPTWLGAYQKAMDGAVDGLVAGDENVAIDYADSILRRSQSAGSAKDLAQIQARPGVRLFTVFYSYFNVLYNLMAQRLKKTKTAADVPALVASMAFLWFLPAVLSELLSGRGPGDDEDPEEWMKGRWLAWALYPLQSVVLVRDLVNSFGPYGYDASPAFDALEQTGKALKLPAKAISDEEDVTRSDVKAVVLATSYWGHLPGRQAWITGSYLYDWMTGEEQPEDVAEVAEGLAFSRPAQ